MKCLICGRSDCYALKLRAPLMAVRKRARRSRTGFPPPASLMPSAPEAAAEPVLAEGSPRVNFTIIPSRPPQPEEVIPIKSSAQRRCEHCPAILSRYNHGPLCHACKRRKALAPPLCPCGRLARAGARLCEVCIEARYRERAA